MSERRYTNEDIAKKFNSNFDLVGHAIHLARDLVQADHDAHVTEHPNYANVVLESLREGGKKGKTSFVNQTVAYVPEEEDEEFVLEEQELGLEEGMVGQELHLAEEE